MFKTLKPYHQLQWHSHDSVSSCAGQNVPSVPNQNLPNFGQNVPSKTYPT